MSGEDYNIDPVLSFNRIGTCDLCSNPAILIVSYLITGITERYCGTHMPKERFADGKPVGIKS